MSLGWTSTRLSGTIPHQVIELKFLRHLALGDTKISGTIPKELWKAGNLNKSEHIARWITYYNYFIRHKDAKDTVTSLNILELFSTRLSGTLPLEMTQMASLHDLLLSNTKVSGTLPSKLGNFTALKTLYLHQNKFTGPLPSFEECHSLTNLTLFDNAFQVPLMHTQASLILWSGTLGIVLQGQLQHPHRAQQSVMRCHAPRGSDRCATGSPARFKAVELK